MPLPKIHKVELLAETRFFKIDSLDLEFSNGARRVYERLPPVGFEGVIVVAVNEDRELLLIREYAAGFHEMQLTLVKGAVDDGESLEEAANRELKEEVGFGARHIEFIKKLNLAPGHMGFTINLLLATDLYPERLPGDEPEPPEVVTWPLEQLDELIAGDEFREARAIAGLFLVRQHLNNSG